MTIESHVPEMVENLLLLMGGCFIGACIGLLTAALCASAAQADREQQSFSAGYAYARNQAARDFVAAARNAGL